MLIIIIVINLHRPGIIRGRDDFICFKRWGENWKKWEGFCL